MTVETEESGKRNTKILKAKDEKENKCSLTGGKCVVEL